MRPARCHRILSRALIGLALIAQLLLPAAQAQLMARGGGLAMLACGAGSPEFIASLRERLPPELLQSVAGEAEAEPGMFCPACCAAGGEGVAPFAPAWPLHAVVPAPPAALRAMAAPPGGALRLPPARAPPQG